VIDDAVEPGAPFSPKKLPIAVGTGALGVLSAVLIAVIVARVGKALDLEEEIQRRFGLPVLGRIPATRALRRSAEGYSDALSLNPELMEAFKTLRTNLELLLLDVPQPAVLAVVSWGEGEGKSTVAAGVALTTAVSGLDVVAVDADLRHPALHARLGQPFGEGMAKATDREIERLVEPTEQNHLWFLSAGIPDRHPADLLPVALGRVLDYAHARDRRLVIDCPPMHGVAETVMVLAAAQNVLVVVDGRKTKLPELEAMIARLHAAGVRVMGVVLNKVQRSKQNSAYPSFVLRDDPMAKTTQTRRARPPRPAKSTRPARRS
jgi:succinoglycan biosynthesis transport protein ExoP